MRRSWPASLCTSWLSWTSQSVGGGKMLWQGRRLIAGPVSPSPQQGAWAARSSRSGKRGRHWGRARIGRAAGAAAARAAGGRARARGGLALGRSSRATAARGRGRGRLLRRQRGRTTIGPTSTRPDGAAGGTTPHTLAPPPSAPPPSLLHPHPIAPPPAFRPIRPGCVGFFGGSSPTRGWGGG